MNTRELCLAVQTQLRARLWDGSGEKVFASGAVLVTLGIDTELAPRLRFPIALVSPLSGAVDPDHKQEPGLVKRQISVWLIASVAGDPWGEGPLIGACRPSTTSSSGAGLLELEEELWAAIKILNALEGINILFVASTVPTIDWVGEKKIAVSAKYVFDALVTTVASS